ncbi:MULTISPECIES: acetyl-CoA sensor PanZ family protein [unclassified Pseudomonas]|uniref:acetyl-CoA sensor PanZ family protein n=1 Tax=unclassified Pseudomonas TaxID=196821 RepID=UPI002AC8D88F|nr:MULTISPECIES: acetyl-CoA sensor PanZ family protein [unclassified Pseudomonas]MEB0043637.1 acetyl-CoA sensor PanZ family protein [Pseudomonas sp. MH10]MEB0076845.1 acetyl-CoA sensor PanZ family protein [Pseudomonas sp. MH10out]MEB0091807.1 acetyl-CoA sensor PanZ family protein [Pseudomonas sp. CCI4.2]MEB0103260.1 acetyl-CoA sensor PanZ family protein [Pseudomonas sp. CCI3.2]MEB0119224.1 acetyl-CoA sensor PanZ family protein [Pseudomonas sp. CCI1.2]
MPIVVESVHSATYQDQEDLQKIYRDAPQWLLAPFHDGQALIESGLSEGTLLAARFNDRLLGAACVQRNNNIWHLSQLCVRKLTRRRGVAERLLVEAQKMARVAGCELRLLAPVGHLEAQALAAKFHLILDPQLAQS